MAPYGAWEVEQSEVRSSEVTSTLKMKEFIIRKTELRIQSLKFSINVYKLANDNTGRNRLIYRQLDNKQNTAM